MNWNGGRDCVLLPSSDPRVFGPPVWLSVHIMAANYPTIARRNVRKACRRFLTSLPYMLPCDHCGAHLRQYLRDHRTELHGAIRTRENLVTFCINLHNYVGLHTNPNRSRFPHELASLYTMGYVNTKSCPRVWKEETCPPLRRSYM